MEVIGSGWFWWPLLIVSALVFIYLAASAVTWFVAGTGLLFLFSLYGDASWWAKSIAWTVYLAPLILLGVPFVRRKLVGNRILELFRSSMPPISATERAALEAGSVWWDGELFSGRPRWKTLLSSRPAALSPEEKDFLSGPTEQFCALIDDYDFNSRREMSAAAWEFLKSEGFLGMIIPREYGGKGFSAYGHAAVVMKIATRSLSAALTVMIPNSVGPGKLLLKYGTEEQRKHYLPWLASGQAVPCFAMTGPEAGSDAAALPDAGIVCRQDYRGQPDVLGIRVNFDKRYISLAPIATLLGVAFKLYDPDHLLGDEGKLGITLALIPADAPGVEIGRRHNTLNLGYPNGPVRGKDIFVPMDAVIGGAEQVGKGWGMLMESLTDGRSISLPALTTATAKLASRATGAYARIRYQFKSPVGAFEGVREALAQIAGNTYAMDAARLVTLGALDEGHKPSVISAIVKYNLSDRCRDLISHAMDVHAGAGICLGPRNIIGEFSKFPQIGIAVEGANILTRSMITFGQGVMRCHPYLLTELNAINDEDHAKGAKNFDRVLSRHVAFTVSNQLRTLLLGLTGGRLARSPRAAPEMRYYYRQLSRMSAAFAYVTDVLLVLLRGDLKRRERLSARMADILSQLYIGSAVLKHYEDQGGDETETAFAMWALEDCLKRIQDAFGDLFSNFPVGWLGRLVRRQVFPYGRVYHGPGDELDDQLASILQVPSTARDRLTAGMYLTSNTMDQMARLEEAFAKVTLVEPLEKKLMDGLRLQLVTPGPLEERLDSAVEAKLLTAEEADMVRTAEAARLAALKVDDFEYDFSDLVREPDTRPKAEVRPLHPGM